jgi:rhodanese-related sulfurtransferase
MTGIDVSEAFRRTCEGSAVLVDVRETEEYLAGHARNAQSLPLSSLSCTQLPAGIDVLMICRSGKRSAKAVERARQAGVHAINVDGGTQAWREADLPMDASGPPPPEVA